jgi:hypothetical protein
MSEMFLAKDKLKSFVRSARWRPKGYGLCRMHEGLYAAECKFGLDVAGEESMGFVILLQHSVKMRDGESSDEQVGLFSGAELRNRTHFLL